MVGHIKGSAGWKRKMMIFLQENDYFGGCGENAKAVKTENIDFPAGKSMFLSRHMVGQYFGLCGFDELQAGSGVEWKNPSENQSFGGRAGGQQKVVAMWGGPTGKGLLLIGNKDLLLS